MPHAKMPMVEMTRHEFPLDDGLICLNHAALGPWPRRVAEAVQAFAEENMRRSAANYRAWWLDSQSQLRERLAWLLGGVDVADISIVKNTSEAISIVSQGLRWREGDNVVLRAREFPANRVPWEVLSTRGVEARLLRDGGREGLAEALIAACDERTRLVTVSSVQFDTGELADLVRLGQFCRENGILLLLDVIQSVGVRPLDTAAIRPDFVAGGAHKWLLAPEGVGYLYTTESARLSLELHQYGWCMGERRFDFTGEHWKPARSGRRFEPGTLNAIGMIGLNASLSLLQEVGLATIEERVLANTALLVDALDDIDGLHVVTPRSPRRHAGIVSASVDESVGLSARDVDRALRKRNILTAARAGLLRISPHFYTPEDHLRTAVEAIEEIIGG